MTKAQRRWVYSPQKSSAGQVPASLKAEVQHKAKQLIEETLKSRHVKPPPADNQFNYIADIYTKWYRHYFYFCAKYCSPGPYAIAPYFEAKFARLEYMGGNNFNLAYMRHTGEWFEVYPDLSLDQCLSAIRDDALFHP
jgi:hypothetical protein